MIDPEAPISAPEDFLGQAGLVRRIFSRIGAERPQSVAVIGGKKSGKSSLLAYIDFPSVKEAHLGEAKRYLFCSIPAGSAAAVSPGEFIDGVRRQLPPASASGTNGYEALRASVDALHASGRRLVLLLDDFHLITSNHAFPLEFFSFLRSLANNFNLAYVTTSFLELQKLCAIKDVQESPFFNIFTNLSLGVLTPEEGAALLTRLTGWDLEHSRGVAAWCGSSPYVLKRSAARLLREKGLPSLEPAALERILLPELAPHFQEIVSLMPHDAARPLQALARGKGPESSEAHFLSPLVKQGFLSEKGDALECTNPAFCAFIRTTFSPRMLRGLG